MRRFFIVGYYFCSQSLATISKGSKIIVGYYFCSHLRPYLKAPTFLYPIESLRIDKTKPDNLAARVNYRNGTAKFRSPLPNSRNIPVRSKRRSSVHFLRKKVRKRFEYFFHSLYNRRRSAPYYWCRRRI